MSDTDAVWDAQADFALDLLRASKCKEENTFLSPVSIAVALAMTYTGANGNTKSEMNGVLAKGASGKALHSAFGELVALLNAPNDSVKLHTANRVYVHDKTSIKSDAASLLNKHYATQLTKVNFVQDYEKTRKSINSWVESQTNNRIKDLLADGTLDPLTRMVLVNAIYFKGDWEHQFKTNVTDKQTFYVSEGVEKQVDMMHQKKSFAYIETSNAQVLGMPYKGGDIEMFIILPKERFGLDALVKSLTGPSLLAIMRDARNREVEVSLPKFRMEKSFDLCDVLKSLGINDAFDERKADFSQFTDPSKEPLFISKVVHKAFLEVDENGSEAAAATAVVMIMRCAMISRVEPQKFIVDHPFMIVMANKQKHVLFMGQVNQPK